MTPLSSSTLNKVLTKSQTSHTSSAAYPSELLGAPGIHHFTLLVFAEWSAETSRAKCWSIRVTLPGLTTINSPSIGALYSTILAVLHAAPDKLWGNFLLFQRPDLTSLCHLWSQMEDERQRWSTKRNRRIAARSCSNLTHDCQTHLAQAALKSKGYFPSYSPKSKYEETSILISRNLISLKSSQLRRRITCTLVALPHWS